MKKLIGIISAISLLALFSCTSKEKAAMSDNAKKGVDGMHAILKMFETKDFSKFKDYVTDDAVDHAGMNGDVKGADNIKAELEKYAGMMSDCKNDVFKDLADD